MSKPSQSRKKPLIIDAILDLIGKRGPMTINHLADRINSDGEFVDLRRRWGGSVSANQVYAAMAGLRGRNLAEPVSGVPGKNSVYRLVTPVEPVERVEWMGTRPEAVDHPPHYGGGDNPYEVIKVIEAWGLGFRLGNTVKYIARADHKGAALQDLEKARWYLDREIANRKAEA